MKPNKKPTSVKEVLLNMQNKKKIYKDTQYVYIYDIKGCQKQKVLSR